MYLRYGVLARYSCMALQKVPTAECSLRTTNALLRTMSAFPAKLPTPAAAPVDWRECPGRLAAMRESVHSLERRLARPDHEWLNERESRAHSSGSRRRRSPPPLTRRHCEARRSVSSVQQLQHLRDGDFEPKTLRLRGDNSTTPEPEPEPEPGTEPGLSRVGAAPNKGDGAEGRDVIQLATPRGDSDD